jgi:ADP-ribosylglycohydrolase
LNSQEAIEKSGQSSVTTHSNVASVNACRYFGALIVSAVSGSNEDEMLYSQSSAAEYWKKKSLVNVSISLKQKRKYAREKRHF